MLFDRALAVASLTALAFSSVISIKPRDANNDAIVSSMLNSMSSQYNDPAYASALMSNALGYISSDLPDSQKPIKQQDLQSVVDSLAPKVAPSIVSDAFSSAKSIFDGMNLPEQYSAQISSVFSYLAKGTAAKSMSSIIVDVLHKEAGEYQLEGNIGEPTAITNGGVSASAHATTNASIDHNSSPQSASNPGSSSHDSSDHSAGSTAKLVSFAVPVSAAAIGMLSMLF
ncbi:hypothetical protein GGI25_000605 [Coemansia spiralis]|uniref:Uncharacterized protein n=2 Tax=Coemansia TaxID=4863 RepID=A0A9W8L198_9FUNG|nr:hypothetical protein BX070DRAFT_228436 [Coemansia spiralis]KAJ1996064.1 hypothetical protein EDC05_000432 [Coemansia umbellata]KAJ2625506.1 hypothetical protein GGI26_000646 [Coemansia sp. RSA 1358]KAJ2680632.1 hypothetical protein GGI25_000605 [Coemansia spiralis]